MTPIAPQVKVIFHFITKCLALVFYKHFLFTLICKFYTECPQFAIQYYLIKIVWVSVHIPN